MESPNKTYPTEMPLKIEPKNDSIDQKITLPNFELSTVIDKNISFDEYITNKLKSIKNNQTQLPINSYRSRHLNLSNMIGNSNAIGDSNKIFLSSLQLDIQHLTPQLNSTLFTKGFYIKDKKNTTFSTRNKNEIKTEKSKQYSPTRNTARMMINTKKSKFLISKLNINESIIHEYDLSRVWSRKTKSVTDTKYSNTIGLTKNIDPKSEQKQNMIDEDNIKIDKDQNGRSFSELTDDFSFLVDPDDKKIDNINDFCNDLDSTPLVNLNLILKEKLRSQERSTLFNSRMRLNSRRESNFISKRDFHSNSNEPILPQKTFQSPLKKPNSFIAIDEKKSRSTSKSPLELNNLNSSQILPTSQEEFLFPIWMKNHPDFDDAYSQNKKVISGLIPAICKKEPHLRDEEHKKVVVKWLRKIHLFKQMPIKIVNEIDVIVNGKYMNQAKTGEVIGNMALEHSGARIASLIASEETTLLLLDKVDYESIISRFINSEKEEYLNFIKGIKIFEKMDHRRINLLQNNILGRFYPKNELIYDYGDLSENFYILKEGIVQIEVNVDIQRENIWPMTTHQWHRKKITRTIAYKKLLYPGAYFGEIEIIRNTKRLNKIIAYEDSYLLLLHKSRFLDIFDNYDIRKFNLNSDNYTLVNTDSIKNEISKKEKELILMKDALVTTISKNMRPQKDLKELPRITPILNKIQTNIKKQMKDITCKVDKKEEILDNIIILQKPTKL